MGDRPDEARGPGCDSREAPAPEGTALAEAPPSDARRDPRDRLPLCLIVPLSVSTVCLIGTRVALALAAVHLHASPLAVGVLLSLMGLLPIVLAVTIGRAVDRLGHFRPALVGLTMMVAGGLIAALWTSIIGLGVAAVVIGSGYTIGFVALNNAVGHATSISRRTEAFSLVAMGFSLANVLGPVLAGYAIDHAGDAAAFGVLAAAPALSAAIVLRWGRPRWDGPARPAESARRGGLLELLRHAPLRSVLIVSALMAIGVDTFTFMAPLYGAYRGLSATAIGVVMGSFGVGSYAVRLAIPFLMRAFDERSVLTWALRGAAVCYAAFPLARSLYALVPIALVFGTLLGTAFPLAMGLVHRVAPPSRTGEAVGVRSAIVSGSHTALPLGFGAVGTAIGIGPVFWITAAILAVGGLYAARALPTGGSGRDAG